MAYFPMMKGYTPLGGKGFIPQGKKRPYIQGRGSLSVR